MFIFAEMTCTKVMRTRVVLLALMGLWGCAAHVPDIHPDFQRREGHAYPTEEPAFTLFLSGDGGAPITDDDDPYLNALKTHLEKMGENAALLFLGDNIYPAGLPDSADAKRKTAENILRRQIWGYENFK